MADDLDDVCTYLRSCLTTHNEPISISNLVGDYQQQIGGEIPFREFNYRNLLDFLKSIPDCVRVIERGNSVFVEGVASKKSEHMKTMVAGQKAVKKKSKGGFRSPRFPTHNNAFPSHSKSPYKGNVYSNKNYSQTRSSTYGGYENTRTYMAGVGRGNGVDRGNGLRNYSEFEFDRKKDQNRSSQNWNHRDTERNLGRYVDAEANNNDRRLRNEGNRRDQRYQNDDLREQRNDNSRRVQGSGNDDCHDQRNDNSRRVQGSANEDSREQRNYNSRRVQRPVNDDRHEQRNDNSRRVQGPVNDDRHEQGNDNSRRVQGPVNDDRHEQRNYNSRQGPVNDDRQRSSNEGSRERSNENLKPSTSMERTGSNRSAAAPSRINDWDWDTMIIQKQRRDAELKAIQQPALSKLRVSDGFYEESLQDDEVKNDDKSSHVASWIRGSDLAIPSDDISRSVDAARLKRDVEEGNNNRYEVDFNENFTARDVYYDDADDPRMGEMCPRKKTLGRGYLDEDVSPLLMDGSRNQFKGTVSEKWIGCVARTHSKKECDEVPLPRVINADRTRMVHVIPVERANTPTYHPGCLNRNDDAQAPNIPRNLVNYSDLQREGAADHLDVPGIAERHAAQSVYAASGNASDEWRIGGSIHHSSSAPLERDLDDELSIPQSRGLMDNRAVAPRGVGRRAGTLGSRYAAPYSATNTTNSETVIEPLQFTIRNKDSTRETKNSGFNEKEVLKNIMHAVHKSTSYADADSGDEEDEEDIGTVALTSEHLENGRRREASLRPIAGRGQDASGRRFAGRAMPERLRPESAPRSHSNPISCSMRLSVNNTSAPIKDTIDLTIDETEKVETIPCPVVYDLIDFNDDVTPMPTRPTPTRPTPTCPTPTHHTPIRPTPTQSVGEVGVPPEVEGVVDEGSKGLPESLKHSLEVVAKFFPNSEDILDIMKRLNLNPNLPERKVESASTFDEIQIPNRTLPGERTADSKTLKSRSRFSSFGEENTTELPARPSSSLSQKKEEPSIDYRYPKTSFKDHPSSRSCVREAPIMGAQVWRSDNQNTASGEKYRRLNSVSSDGSCTDASGNKENILPTIGLYIPPQLRSVDTKLCGTLQVQVKPNGEANVEHAAEQKIEPQVEPKIAPQGMESEMSPEEKAVKELCVKHNLLMTEEIGKRQYKMVNLSKRYPNLFTCILTIDGVRYAGGILEDCHDMASCRKEAYKKAFHTLTPMLAKSNTPATTDIELFVRQFDKLFSDCHLLDEHMADDMESYYVKTYGARPPDDWLRVVKGRSAFWVVKTHVGLANRETVSLARRADVLPKVELPLVDQEARVRLASVESPMVVYVHLLEYAREFDEMMVELNKTERNAASTTNLKQGSLYSAFVQNGRSQFYRLRLVSAPGHSASSLVDCFMIDYGVVVKLEQGLLHPLHAKFTYLPAQAIRCNLLDEQLVMEASGKRMDLATNVCKNLLVGWDFKATFKRNRDNAPHLSLIEHHSGLPYNRIVLEHVKLTLSFPPALEAGKILEVYVASANLNGECHGRIKSPTLKLLNELLSTTCARANLNYAQSLEVGKLYLAYVSDEWHRARVIDLPNATNCMVKLRLIDFGTLVFAAPSKLVEVDPQSDLSIIPEQVVFMSVANGIRRVFSHLSANCPLWKVRVLESGDAKNLPIVSIVSCESNSPMMIRAEAVDAIADEDTEKAGCVDIDEMRSNFG